MFYALRVKIFCSLSELELLKLKHSFPFFLGGGGGFAMLVRTSFTIYVKYVAVGNRLNIETSDITSNLLEYLRMLAVHSVMYYLASWILHNDRLFN